MRRSGKFECRKPRLFECRIKKGINTNSLNDKGDGLKKKALRV